MVWKFVVAITLIAVVVEGRKSRRWPCNQAKNKLDVCRENGYVIGDCKVGDGELTAWQRRKCEKMEDKYGKKCSEDYEKECEKGDYIAHE